MTSYGHLEVLILQQKIMVNGIMETLMTWLMIGEDISLRFLRLDMIASMITTG